MRPHVMVWVGAAIVCNLMVLTTSETDTGICEHDEGEEIIKRGFIDMQAHCKDPNRLMMESEYNKDHSGVCRGFYSLLKCVATNVTYCYQYFMMTFKHYTHSPHNCGLTGKQILELQGIVRAANKRDQPITTSSSTTTPSPSRSPQQPTPKYKLQTGETEGHSPEVGITTQDGKTGSSSSTGHSGTEGSKGSHRAGKDSNGQSTSLYRTSSQHWITLLSVSVWLSWLLIT